MSRRALDILAAVTLTLAAVLTVGAVATRPDLSQPILPRARPIIVSPQAYVAVTR